MENLSVLEERILAYYDRAFFQALALNNHNTEEAKDFVQQMALKILTVKPNAESLGADYFERTIKNIWIDRLRKDNTEKENEFHFHETVIVSSEEKTIDDKLQINTLKSIMTEEEWGCLRMTAEGYSQAEIESHFQKNEQWVKNRLRNARKKAKKTLLNGGN